MLIMHGAAYVRTKTSEPPSSSEPNASLTAWDASPSHLTLFVMLVAVMIFLTIVLAYTAWIYLVLRGKVPCHISEPGGHVY